MIGRTNVGGGSTFSATLVITTDALASISAVNPAGDTYTGTADSNGSLTLVINHPGTYTVTETLNGATSTGTVPVADNEGTVSFSIYAWDGQLYDEGEEYENVTGGWIASETYTGYATNYVTLLPTLTKEATYMEAEFVKPANSSYTKVGAVRITNAIDITDYSSITLSYSSSATNTADAMLLYIVDSSNNAYSVSLDSNTDTTTAVLDVSSYSGEFYVGINFECSPVPSCDQAIIINSVLCS